jgi:hypothetical protein
MSQNQYSQRLKSLLGVNDIFLLPLWEASGATANDISGNGYNGTVVNPTWGQGGIGDGRTALSLAGTGVIKSFPAGAANAFNGATGFFTAWIKMTTAVWEDLTNDYLLQITAGADQVWIRKAAAAARRLQAAHIASGVSRSFDINGVALTDWFNFTVTWGPGGLIGYINGTVMGGPTAAVGAWAGGVPTVFVVCASSTGPGNPYNGLIQYASVGTKELTPTEVRAIASPLDDPVFLPAGATLLTSGYAFPMALGSVIYAGHGHFASKSTDQGDTWTDFSKDFGTDVHSVFPATNGYLYAGLGTGVVWRSVDNGANWTLECTTTGGYPQPWSWAEASDGTLFFGEYTGPPLAGENHVYIWRSVDDGDTWVRRDGLNGFSNKHVHVVMLDPETDRLYVSIGDTPKTCYYSDDHGDTWTELFAITDKGFTGITSTAAARFFGDDRAAPANRILKTTDDITPTIAYIPSWEYNDSYIEVASIHGTNTLFATIWNEDQRDTQKSVLLRSDDAGATWQVIGNAPSGGYKFHTICFDYRHRIPAELGYLICECVDNTQMMRIPI